jgi:hypothetical protein
MSRESGSLSAFSSFSLNEFIDPFVDVLVGVLDEICIDLTQNLKNSPSKIKKYVYPSITLWRSQCS